MFLLNNGIKNTEHFLLQCHAYSEQRCDFLGAINEVLQLQIFKCLEGTSIPNLASYIEKVDHNYNTRGNSSTLRLPQVRTDAARKSIYFQRPSCYNEIPIDSQKLTSIVQFKYRLKEHFLNN